jgi:hypothetical protein
MKIRTALPRALAAPLLTLALAAGAAPVYLIDATTNGLAPDASLSNVGFSLTYEDFNLDALFSLNELLAFTGVYDSANQYFDQLLGTPTAPGITGTGTVWVFGDSNGQLTSFSAAAGAFTPFVTGPLAGPVPEPGALALTLAAFAALGLTRRFGRKAAS